MKKYFFTMVVMAIFAIGFAASDDSDSSSISNEEVPANVPTVRAETMISDLSNNAMKAKQEYSDKWLEIVGNLGNMDSDGAYFSLDGDSFSMISVHCDLPKDKKEELQNKLMNMDKGSRVAVKGKVTDVGEVLGYTVVIVDVYRK